MKETSIFLVDDHALLRKTMRVYLERQPDLRIVGEAGSGKDALAALADCTPDILLLDISLPDISGTAVAVEALPRRQG